MLPLLDVAVGGMPDTSSFTALEQVLMWAMGVLALASWGVIKYQQKIHEAVVARHEVTVTSYRGEIKEVNEYVREQTEKTTATITNVVNEIKRFNDNWDARHPR